MKCLIIRKPWIDKIFDGNKTWELRSSRTSVRGPIGLITGGTGQITGCCQIDEVLGPFSRSELDQEYDKHGVPPEFLLRVNYDKIYAWVLSQVHRYEVPIVYKHPQGAIKWVNVVYEEE